MTGSPHPVVIAPSPIQHFYLGGDRIAELRGVVQRTDRQPEEWLGSTVSRADDPEAGLAVTNDGVLLRDLIAADPVGWIGPEPGSNTVDTGILMKLLDPRQRLPVHVHPDRAFATTHLHCPYGKTEAWFVLDADPGTAFHLGWKRSVDAAELAARRDAQDSQWMLDHMNRVPARAGMGVLVPARTAHAIDGGVFVTEVQEPTDFSILLEWSVTTSSRADSHLGIGFDAVMPAVSHEALSASALDALVCRAGETPIGQAPQSVLPAAADPFFRLRQVSGERGGSGDIHAGFAIVLIVEGEGRLSFAAGSTAVRRGEVVAMPQSLGPWRLEGPERALIGGPGIGWPQTL